MKPNKTLFPSLLPDVFLCLAYLSLGLAAGNLSAAPAEGDLIQADGTIYVIHDGLRCKISRMELFDACGFKRENVVPISDEDLAAISEGPMFTSPIKQPYKTAKDGDLILATGGTIFLIRDGLRCRIPNMEIFKENGFAEADIINISDEDLEAIPEGPMVK